MAYDKIVDSAALDGALTDIADAIREKTGSTEKLTLEGMAAAIAGLNVGNGGATGIYMANITPASNLNDFTITHNLGTTDILFVAVWAETLNDITPSNSQILCKYWAKTSVTTRRGGNGFCAGYTWSTTNNYSDVSAPNSKDYETLNIIDANNVRLPRATSGSNNGYIAGVTYTVIVIAENAEV